MTVTTTQLYNLTRGFPILQESLDRSSLTPPQITANQNNYDPVNPGRKKIWRVSSDASRTITGFLQHSIDGEEIILVNVGTQPIVVSHENASSTAANRVITDITADITLRGDDILHLQYDLTSARWRHLWRPSKTSNKRLNAQFATGNTTATNVTNMFFNVDANELWQFSFDLRTGKNSGTAGIKFALAIPAGSTLMATVMGTTSGVTAFTSSIITASATLTTEVYNTVANLNGVARIAGTLSNGATAGTVQLMLAAVTNQTASIEAGSSMWAAYSVTA